MNKNIIALDFGSSDIRIWTKENGLVFYEPSVVSIDNSTGKVDKYGEEAKKLVGKTAGGNTRTVFPIRNGVIAEVDEATKMLYAIFKKLNILKVFSRPSVLVSVPESATSVEKGAIIDAVYRAGAKNGGVMLVHSPVAAALGAGIDIEKPRGNMIVDIGCEKTEAVIFSLGGKVVSKKTNIASRDFDEAIVSYMRRCFNVDIGTATAEKLKKAIGSIIPSPERRERTLKGIDANTTTPITVSVNSNMISDAIREQSQVLIRLLKDTMYQASDEINGDIGYNGITLVGGGSLIGGMTQMIRTNFGVPVRIAENPEFAVIKGLARIIEEDLVKYIEIEK